MEHAVITLQAKAGFQPMLSIDACHPPGFLQGKCTLHWLAEFTTEFALLKGTEQQRLPLIRL